MSILWLTLEVIGFLVLVVLTQDIQVFPGVLFSLFSGSSRDPKTLPRGVESVFITTADGKRLEVWRLPADEAEPKQPYIGLVFHGNGASLESFLAVQLWFSYMGITSYGFDYRGFGKSSGWPSERGIEQDSDTFWNYVVEREQIDPSRVIVFGMSVGSAPAARIASIHQPRTLILVSAFTDLKQAAREQFLVGFFAPFVWYKFPTIDYVRKLEKTNLVLAHGEKDKLVRPYHTVKLKESYCGSGSVERITSSVPGHNAVFYAIREKLSQALFQSL